MPSPLQRLYRTKLTLLAVLLTITGAALLVATTWTTGRAGWHWFGELRPVEVGVALITGGALAVLLQYVGKRDADEQLRHELRQAIRSEAPAIRDAVINGFAFDPGALADVASATTLDRIAENSLTIQLGDQELARHAYRALRERVLRTSERCYEGRVSVALAPWEGGPSTGKGSMFVATIRWEYRTTTNQSTFRFNCVASQDEYREMLHDPTSIHTWYFEPIAGLAASSLDVFCQRRSKIDPLATVEF